MSARFLGLMITLIITSPQIARAMICGELVAKPAQVQNQTRPLRGDSLDIIVIRMQERTLLEETSNRQWEPAGVITESRSSLTYTVKNTSIEYPSRLPGNTVAGLYRDSRKVQNFSGQVMSFDFNTRMLEVALTDGRVESFHIDLIRHLFVKKGPNLPRVSEGPLKGKFLGRLVSLSKAMFGRDLAAAYADLNAFIKNQLSEGELWSLASPLVDTRNGTGARFKYMSFYGKNLSFLNGKTIVGIRASWTNYVETFGGTVLEAKLLRSPRGETEYYITVQSPTGEVFAISTEAEVIHRLYYLEN